VAFLQDNVPYPLEIAFESRSCHRYIICKRDQLALNGSVRKQGARLREGSAIQLVMGMSGIVRLQEVIVVYASRALLQLLRQWTGLIKFHYNCHPYDIHLLREESEVLKRQWGAFLHQDGIQGIGLDET
jgi:hypothetical protein